MKNFTLFFTFVFSIIVLTANAQVLEKDSLALVDLYNSTSGASWKTKTNWLSGNVSTWYGIYLTGNRVNKIKLSSNTLNGVLPNSFGDLDAITYIDIHSNIISGALPESFGNLINLNYLHIGSNSIDSIPASFGNLSSLATAYLFYNDIKTLPDTIRHLSNLTTFQINSNLITEFPYWIGSMPQLFNVDFSYNSFNTSFPDTLYNLPNLLVIGLRNCGISGSLNSNVANWPAMVNLYFDDNDMSGVIPSEIGNLTDLQNLWLNGNNFTDSIPVSINNCSVLEKLRLADNDFDGLPNITALTSLTELTTENNLFTFEDFEPNMGMALTTFTYSPQDSVYKTSYPVIKSGDSLVLTAKIGGTANQYQWYKDGSAIVGATNFIYKISNAAPGVEGTYTCEITNTTVSALTIHRRPAFVDYFDPTNIVENNFMQGIKIIQNPVENGLLTIHFLNEISNASNISIVNSIGQQLYSQTLKNIHSNFSQIIDVSKLTNGLYTVVIQNGDRKCFAKVVLEK